MFGIEFSGDAPVNGWTFLVSVLGSFVGAFGLYRTIRYQPKPLWKLRTDWSEYPEASRGAYAAYFFDVINVGSGPAYDVEVEVVSPRGMEKGTTEIRSMSMDESLRGRSDIVNSGERIRVPVSFLKNEDVPNTQFPNANFVTKGVGLKVKYTRPPRLKKTRARTFKIDKVAPQIPLG